MMDSHEFLLKHSQEWSEKYPGKCIAVVDDKLVAIWPDELEVFRETKRKYPDKDISIAYIPTDDEVVMLLREGLNKARISVTGNTIVDAVYQNPEIIVQWCEMP